MIPTPPELPQPDALASPPPAPSRAWERIAAIGEVILCSSIPTQLLVAIVAAQLFGIAPQTADGKYSLDFILIVTLADTALLIGLMVFFTRRRGESPAALWMGTRPPVPEALHGFALIPVAFMLVIVLLGSLRLAAPWLHNVPENPLESLARGGMLNAILFGVVVIVAGGVREEMVRAFLLQRFERHLGGMTTGIVVLSIAFGLGHANQGWDAAITTGVLGAFWAIVYARRRSSIAPIVSHAGFNSLEVVRIVVTGP